MGFSGLSSLASEVEEAVVAEQAGRRDQADRAADRQVEPQSRAPTATKRGPLPQSDQEVVASGMSRTPTSRSTGARWFWGLLVGVAVVIILINVAQEDNNGPSTASSQKPPASSASDAPSGTRRAQIPELEFSRPPVGDNNVLSVAQIRWCLREDIRIGVLRPLPTSNAQIDQFNAVVTDYNSRCGSYRYRQATMTRAQREVERARAQIVASVHPPWLASVPSAGSASRRPSVATEQQRSQLTLDVQNALIELGYKPGSPDGFYGARTRSAIQSFRRDIGLPADGRATQALLERLRTEAASRRSRGISGISGGVTSPGSTAGFERGSTGTFTRNSHQNDVLRLQGTPSDIKRYDYSGYETWHFGPSTVKIDSRTRQVLEWNNEGNLNVRM